MIFDVNALATERHLETQHNIVDWTKALESAKLTLKPYAVDYQGLELIAKKSRSPAHFTSMARLIYQHCKSHVNGEKIFEVILGIVNQSLFSLADWIDSVDYFYKWLLARNRKIDFLSMLNYLECCAAAPDAKKGRHTLLALAEDMLAVHGYEAG